MDLTPDFTQVRLASPTNAGDIPPEMHHRLLKILKKTWTNIRFDYQATAGHEVTPDEIRSAVADHVDVDADDGDAKRYWRGLDLDVQEFLLNEAFPG